MGDADDELVVDVVVGEAGTEPWLDGQRERSEFRGVGECLAIPAGFCAAFGAPEVEVWEFDVQHGGLDGVDAEVTPDVGVEVAWLHAVVPEAAHLCRERIVFTGHHSGVAERSEIFGRVEGVPACFADGAGGAEGMCGAEGLGCVFENGHSVGGTDAGDGLHVCAAAEEVDGADRFGVGVLLECVIELSGVDVEGVGLDIDKNGARSDARNAACGCEEGVGGGDDDVAGFDAERHEEDQLGVGAGGDSDAMGCAGGVADGFLEIFRLFAKHELL